MIEKERLEKLIEERATIYEVKYGKVNPVSLKNKIRFVSDRYPVVVFEPRPNEKYKHRKYFDKLFEDREDAEWVATHHANREIKFTPCSYEDTKRYSINDCYTYCFVDAFLIPCEIVIDFEEDYVCVNRGNFTPSVFNKVTKENYIKAVEKAYNLFKGEEE